MRRQWGCLTDDDIEHAEGKREKLSGLLQEKYGKAKEEIDKEVDRFRKKTRGA